MNPEPKNGWPGIAAIQEQAHREADILLIKLVVFAVLLVANIMLWSA